MSKHQKYTRLDKKRRCYHGSLASNRVDPRRVTVWRDDKRRTRPWLHTLRRGKTCNAHVDPNNHCVCNAVSLEFECTVERNPLARHIDSRSSVVWRSISCAKFDDEAAEICQLHPLCYLQNHTWRSTSGDCVHLSLEVLCAFLDCVILPGRTETPQVFWQN